MSKSVYSFGLAALLSLVLGTASRAAELVMFESSTCEWCEAWNEEIGGIYDKTDEAKIAPLRRVSIDDPIPQDLAQIRGIHYTPTFVLMSDGKEVGRILGYPGQDFFWGLLDVELRKLKKDRHEGGTQHACGDGPDGRNSHENVGDSTVSC
jgi:thioredoxin-related protein